MNDNHPCVRPRVAEPSRSNENEGGLHPELLPAAAAYLDTGLASLAPALQRSAQSRKGTKLPDVDRVLLLPLCWRPRRGHPVCVCLCVSELGIPVA